MEIKSVKQYNYFQIETDEGLFGRFAGGEWFILFFAGVDHVFLPLELMVEDKERIVELNQIADKFVKS